jgi:two-component system NtrC family sensor kinase
LNVTAPMHAAIPKAAMDLAALAADARAHDSDAAPKAQEAPMYSVDDSGPELLPLIKVVADNSQNPIFLIDPGLEILYANRAAHAITVQIAVGSGRQPGTRRINELHPDLLPSFALEMAASAGEWNGEVALPLGQRRPLVLMLQITAIRSEDRSLQCYGVSARDISFEYARKTELQARNAELEVAYRKLKGAQEQLLQSEKLASIGQLAAGVAHEINNPIGYVHSNLATLQEYSKHLLTLIEAYGRALDANDAEGARGEVRDLRQRLDIEFLQSDLPQLIEESREGIERVRKIVQDLKDFSRSDARDKFVLADIHRGLDSTLNIIWNDLKYKAQVVKTFGEVPQIECIPSELNQVFMNILLNAGQAIAERGIVTVSTSVDGDHLVIAIGDDGVGIPEDVLPRIFDPFFTTKPVGTGTGLGLAISYGLIKKHHGSIDVTSTPGEGTLFLIRLPITQPKIEGQQP